MMWHLLPPPTAYVKCELAKGRRTAIRSFRTMLHHFDYMVDAYVAVLAPVTCQAWLEICCVGKSTSHVAQDRAKEYCDTTGIAPREDAI
jgi:hypothetical protein